ncbi:MAG: transcriptional regulator [Legionella sp.]|nr:MAG: transcriptional regulator [Legionella sp.]
MMQSTEQIGKTIRLVRKKLGVTQRDLALTAGTGLRFIIELEKGKATCQIGKVLQVLHVLGIQLQLSHLGVACDDL